MKRGEVWWVSLDPALGSEVRKTRPAVIVSNDASNKILDRVQVAPVSSQTAKIYPCEALITIKGKHNKAMADQLRTVSKQRLSEFIAKLHPDEMAALDRAIKLQLALS